jgi:hypothetical protein
MNEFYVDGVKIEKFDRSEVPISALLRRLKVLWDRYAELMGESGFLAWLTDCLIRMGVDVPRKNPHSHLGCSQLRIHLGVSDR